MEKTVIQAEKRAVVGKQVRALRREGKLPAVIYGFGIDPLSIILDAHSASRILAKASSSTLVTIELAGKEYPTLVREKQHDFIRNELIHVDFLAVSMTEKITASVGIVLEGTAPVVKDFDATIVNNLTELEVECLPTDLPERFTVDISGLAEVGDAVYVKDVPAPDKVDILTDPEELIVVATAAAAEEIEEEVLEEEEGEEPEVIEKGKKEEEEKEKAE
jgi:large subunit ribosomal protein L25